MSLAGPAADARLVPPGPSRPVRVAVVGLGRRGTAHAAVLGQIPDCSLAGLVDASARARAIARGTGFEVPSYADVRDLLAKERPDAIVVATPQAQRADVATRAIEAGVPVLVERPMSHVLADAEALCARAAPKAVPLAVAHGIAFHPVFARARDVLASGALGALRRASGSLARSRVFGPLHPGPLDPAQVSGGVVAQDAADLLFFVGWALGVPVAARATWHRADGAIEDELHGSLLLREDRTVGFDASWSVPGFSRPATVLEVEGENGTLLASEDALELELREARHGWQAGDHRWRDVELPQVARFDLEGESLYLQDAAFLAWVTGGSEPPNAWPLALAAQRVIEALYHSAHDGGRAVAVRGESA